MCFLLEKRFVSFSTCCKQQNKQETALCHVIRSSRPSLLIVIIIADGKRSCFSSFLFLLSPRSFTTFAGQFYSVRMSVWNHALLDIINELMHPKKKRDEPPLIFLRVEIILRKILPHQNRRKLNFW